MKKGMTITYEVDSGLYVNITNKCTNRCDFCIRNNGDGAYGSDSLWLEREPTVPEILDSILSRDVTKYSEIVFCGYGEPTVRLADMCEVAKAVKSAHPCVKIRVNTNGHAELMHGDDAARMFAGCIDVVSISLNTPSAEKYEAICHPVYKEKAFPALIRFADNVKNYVQKTLFSVVRETISEDELAECYKIAESIGITLRVRDYISPDAE